MNIDSVNKTIEIAEEKMCRIKVMIKDWRTKKSCSRQQLQSLLGNLLYIHKCVKPAHIFVSRMLELLRANYDKHTITLTSEFRCDLRWFDQFLVAYNGMSYFNHKQVHGTIELDACLTGFGGCWNSYVYHIPIERRHKILAMTQLEMLNILVALRIFGVHWKKQRSQVKCDNLAVVQVLTSGKTRDPF